jgi:cytochrome c553
MTQIFHCVARSGFIGLAALALSVANAQAIDGVNRDVAAKLAEGVCVSCHGTEGRGDNPRIPRLAGQQRAYIEVQLKAFRSQTRSDPAAHEYMWGIAATLSDGVVAGLADYFSTRVPGTNGEPLDEKAAILGKQLFERGSPERGAAPCMACHGAAAEGMGVFPRLAGQHREYLYLQLKLIQNKLRASPVMHGLITQLNNDEIAAVAAYLQSK